MANFNPCSPSVMGLRTSSATEQSTKQVHRALGLLISEMDVNQVCPQKEMLEHLQTNMILKDLPQMQNYCLFHQHQGASPLSTGTMNMVQNVTCGTVQLQHSKKTPGREFHCTKPTHGCGRSK